MGEILQALMTLGMVIFILYLSYVFSKYVGKGIGVKKSTRHMLVLDRLVLSQDKSIAVVQVGCRYFLIGVASSQINVLTELSGDDLVELQESAIDANLAPIDFKSLLKQMAGRKDKEIERAHV